MRVEPGAIAIEVADREPLMAAAIRHGYRWPTICGGAGTCTACYVVVLEGRENLSPARHEEERTVEPLLRRHPGAAAGVVRLACQAEVLGDVTVFKRGVRAGGARARARSTVAPVGSELTGRTEGGPFGFRSMYERGENRERR